jgi:hypothetical protein
VSLSMTAAGRATRARALVSRTYYLVAGKSNHQQAPSGGSKLGAALHRSGAADGGRKCNTISCVEYNRYQPHTDCHSLQWKRLPRPLSRPALDRAARLQQVVPGTANHFVHAAGRSTTYYE